MTSLAFILGCVPLWIVTWAGTVGRQELGTIVIMGMGVRPAVCGPAETDFVLCN